MNPSDSPSFSMLRRSHWPALLFAAFACLTALTASAAATLTAGAAVPTQVIGDGDAFVESNEIWDLTVPLTNAGDAPATTITAVLSTATLGVTINQPNSPYPDIAAGASASNTIPFMFTVGPTVACGTTIDFVLTVNYTGGASPQTFPFSIRVGAPGTPITFSFTGPPVPIPDAGDLSGTNPGAPAFASLAVAGVPGPVYDINLSIDGTSCSATAGSTTVGIDHTFVNDLRINLLAPSLQTVLVINNTDGSGNNFCQTMLDDEGGGPPIQGVATASAPFTGTFTPNSPLAAFHGTPSNGTWQLEVQDFFSGDTGNIRAFSLIITPAVCDAPPLTANVSGTKTVSGTFSAGGTVTYTVTLTNTGGLAQADNPGNEFTDVLPSSLTLVSANASSGTAVASLGTNTVAWNGALAPVNGSVTITITATVNNVPAGTVVSNQGTISYDSDGNGTNEATAQTDDPGVGGASDPTNFAVVGSLVTATKTASGTFNVGSTVTYTVTISNSGNAASPDNAGNEFTDVLPSSLTLVSANSSSGTAVATVGTNTVTWNGSVPAGGSVTITITATIKPGTGGTTITNQGTVSYDANGDGTNESTTLTDDPAVAGSSNPTVFTVAGNAIETATKSVAGTFAPGSPITYTLVISNSGTAASADNPGNELTDVLPSQLTLVSANASSGTAVATIGTNTVTWNGSVPAGGSVTVTILATIKPTSISGTVSNQATINYDSDANGTNDATTLSNDPSTPAPNDPTSFQIASVIPALSPYTLMLLAALLALMAFKVLKE